MSIIEFEKLREFVIHKAITPVDLYGNSIDVVLTADLVELYEQATGKPFYRRPEHDVPMYCTECDGRGVTLRLLPSGADAPDCTACGGSGLQPR